MAFDPLSWAIGYSLSKGTTWLLGDVYSKKLPSKLSRVTEKWAKKIPKELYYYPSDFFDYSFREVEDRKSLKILRDKLNSIEIPKEKEWYEALKEHWNFIKHNIKNPQPFFTAKFIEIEDYLIDLSSLITNEIITDNDYFRIQISKKVDDILKKQKRNSKSLSDIRTRVLNEKSWSSEISSDSLPDNPVTINKSFQFSDFLLRTVYIDPETNRYHRQIRYRIKLIDGEKPVYNLNVKSFLIVKRLVIQPDNSTGYTSNWNKIKESYIPKLQNYWSVSHFIDPKIGQMESPFFKFINKENIIDVRIRIFLNGESERGKRIFGEWEYEWSKKATIYGRFKLRELGKIEMPDSLFNDIIKINDNKYKWPLFDINRIE